jgi:serine/threonine protein kinase
MSRNHSTSQQTKTEKPSQKMLFEDQKMKTEESTVSLGIEKSFEISDFEIIRDLGKGSFGTVKLVKNILSGNHYALKCLDKKDIKGKK